MFFQFNFTKVSILQQPCGLHGRFRLKDFIHRRKRFVTQDQEKMGVTIGEISLKILPKKEPESS